MHDLHIRLIKAKHGVLHAIPTPECVPSQLFCMKASSQLRQVGKARQPGTMEDCSLPDGSNGVKAGLVLSSRCYIPSSSETTAQPILQA